MMRLTSLLPAAVLLAAILPAASHAAVAIHLKNGMTMTADACDEADGMLTCYKMGGSFLLKRGDVERITEAKGTDVDQPAAAEPAPGEASPEAREGGGAPADKAAEVSPKERFEQIRQRKTELQKEREKLAADREKLQQDVKNAPDWMTTDQFNAISKRNAEVEERLKKFNDEVKQLNQEEQRILGTQQKQKGE